MYIIYITPWLISKYQISHRLTWNKWKTFQVISIFISISSRIKNMPIQRLWNKKIFHNPPTSRVWPNFPWHCQYYPIFFFYANPIFFQGKNQNKLNVSLIHSGVTEEKIQKLLNNKNNSTVLDIQYFNKALTFAQRKWEDEKLHYKGSRQIEVPF